MLLLLMLFILNESYSIENNNSKEWIKYKNKYSENITYWIKKITRKNNILKFYYNLIGLNFNSISEEIKRQNEFMLNSRRIEKHNNNSSSSYQLKLNKNSHYSNSG